MDGPLEYANQQTACPCNFLNATANLLIARAWNQGIQDGGLRGHKSNFALLLNCALGPHHGRIRIVLRPMSESLIRLVKHEFISRVHQKSGVQVLRFRGHQLAEGHDGLFWCSVFPSQLHYHSVMRPQEGIYRFLQVGSRHQETADQVSLAGRSWNVFADKSPPLRSSR